MDISHEDKMRQFSFSPAFAATAFLLFTAAACFGWWQLSPSVQDYLDAAGALNACAGRIADCTAIAEGR